MKEWLFRASLCCARVFGLAPFTTFDEVRPIRAADYQRPDKPYRPATEPSPKFQTDQSVPSTPPLEPNRASTVYLSRPL